MSSSTYQKAVIIGCADGSQAKDLLAAAHDVAAPLGARIVVAAVHRASGPYPEHVATGWEAYFRDRAIRHLDAFEANGGEPIERRLVGADEFLDGLLSAADSEHAAAIVVGETRWFGVDRLLMGDIDKRLVRHSNCPVVMVPRGYAKRHHGAEVAA